MNIRNAIRTLDHNARHHLAQATQLTRVMIYEHLHLRAPVRTALLDAREHLRKARFYRQRAADGRLQLN